MNRIGDTLAELSGRAAGRRQTWRAPASQEPLSRSARAFGRATSHLNFGAVTGTGPAQDWPDFTPAMRQAAGLLRFDTVLADAGYDAEHNHRLCREELGLRRTVINFNPRNRGPRPPPRAPRP